MSLEYALVTSSSLPEQVKASDHFVEVDKAQWLDLVDYSQDIVEQDSSQQILFLIVAKGTQAQEKADAEREAARAARIKELEERENHLSRREEEELASEKEKAAKRRSDQERKKALRAKSKSIYNALYNR
tara:strand:- start:1038 stop:1427 length:390 start_codon:yes stop_codon:yes gene_type:complete